MSAPRSFLICASEAEARETDAAICVFLRERDDNRGSQWSGVYTSGGKFGVIFEADPCAELYPNATVEAEIVTDGESNWSEVPPPAPPPDEPL